MSRANTIVAAIKPNTTAAGNGCIRIPNIASADTATMSASENSTITRLGREFHMWPRHPSPEVPHDFAEDMLVFLGNSVTASLRKPPGRLFRRESCCPLPNGSFNVRDGCHVIKRLGRRTGGR